MSEITAQLSAAEQQAFIEQVRHKAQAQPKPGQDGSVPLQAAGLESSFDPLRPVASVESDEQNAIGLVTRGVRLAPFAESTPLVPLYRELGHALPATLKIAHEQQAYNFVLVQLTFSLRLGDDEVPDYAQFVVDIEDGVEGPRATRTHEMFPQQRHASWFRANAALAVALDTSMQFNVAAALPALSGAEALPVASAEAQAQAEGQAKLGVNALVGPFRIELGRTELEVAGSGDRNISWIYRAGDALAGKSDFKSFLVLKVARETTRVELRSQIGVRTYRRSWRTLWLRDVMPILRADARLSVELPK